MQKKSFSYQKNQKQIVLNVTQGKNAKVKSIAF